MLDVGMYIIYFSAMIIQQVIIVKLFTCILEAKLPEWLVVICLTVGNVFQIYLKSVLPQNAFSSYMMFLFLIPLILVLFFKGKWHQKVIAFMLNSIMLVVAELVCVQIAFGYMDYHIDNITSGITFEAVFISTIGVFVTGILAYLVIIAQKPLKYIIFAPNMIPFFVVIFIQIVTIFLYCGLLLHHYIEKDWLLWIYFFSIVLVDLYIVQTMGEIEVWQQSLEKLEFIQRKDENVQKYYHNLVSKLQNTTELRDEYQRKLGSIYAELGMAYEQDMSLSGKKETTLWDEGVTTGTVVSGYLQAIVEQIVESKKRELDKLGYSYDLDIQIPEEAAIELMDISGLLNNLLDNAVEAVHGYVENARKTKEKCGQESKEKRRLTGSREDIYIRGKSYIEEDMLVIEVENVKSPEQKIIEIGDRFVTSKTDKTGHGYGLQIIQRIAEKYDGRMDVSYTKEYFVNKVTMKIK